MLPVKFDVAATLSLELPQNLTPAIIYYVVRLLGLSKDVGLARLVLGRSVVGTLVKPDLYRKDLVNRLY